MNDYIQEKMKVFGNSTFKWVDLEDGNGKYLWHEDVKKYYEKIIREAYTRGIEDALKKVPEEREVEVINHNGEPLGENDLVNYAFNTCRQETIDGIKSLIK